MPCAFVLAILGVNAPVYADPNTTDNSIYCVESKIEKLNNTDEGKRQLAARNVIDLAYECGNEHSWTLRKATAAGFYTAAETILKTDRVTWTRSGFPSDLPDRMQKRMMFKHLNEMVIDSNPAYFVRILSEELAVTGSKLNINGSIDKLSIAESSIVGEKLGRLLMALFTRDETLKFFNDPTYKSPDFISLYVAIEPQSSELLASLK